MKRLTQTVLLGLLGLGATILGIEVWRAREAPAPAQAVQTPQIALPDLEGQIWRSDSAQGKVVLINFWASWCAPCVKEVPALVEAQRQWGDHGLQVVGIALDEGEPVRAFARRMHINYPVLLAGMDGFDLSQSFGNEILSIPFSVVLDRGGRIRYRHLGVLTPDQLRGWIPPLLAEAVARQPERQAE
jgi:thiol-disulfide isomerase/thioredoxin